MRRNRCIYVLCTTCMYMYIGYYYSSTSRVHCHALHFVRNKWSLIQCAVVVVRKCWNLYGCEILVIRSGFLMKCTMNYMCRKEISLILPHTLW